MAQGKWFGRDPAIIVAQVVSAVTALVVLSSIPEAVEAAIVVVVTFAGGVVVAFAVVKDGQVPAIVGFARAGIALLVLVKFNWSPEYQALLLIAVEQVAAFFFIKPAVVAPIDANGQRVAPAPVRSAA